MALRFYNTLTREKEEFKPIDPMQVGFYSCGPTVYNYAHIGNLRAYVFADLVQKMLEIEGYKVKRVMNITDIGHLTSDADDGDDKMVKGLKREGKPFTLEAMKEMAVFYKDRFMEDFTALNIKSPDVIPFASEHIAEDVEMIEKLLEKGFAYKTSDGIYFEIAKFPDYWVMSGRSENQEEESESRIGINAEKKNPTDFAIWKFSKEGELGYDTTIGKGFPGWHIECSAMSIKYLGEQFDIHTGGVDHITVHHPNEIAQSEAYTGKKPFVKFWMHNEHVNINDSKMAKSGDNFITMQTLVEKNINPIAYRLWLLMAHYRTQMNFNWEALEGAEIALKRLYSTYNSLKEEAGEVSEEYKMKFLEYLENDLDTPRALTVLWDLLKDESIIDSVKKATLLYFDRVFSFGLENLKEEKIPNEIIQLAEERELARQNKDFKKSDELREKINSLGYEVKDIAEGYKVNKI
ncbi:MAG: cysteine--tRNA ligase [Patescibacteria group bacterium]